jgi:hypothetical protein
MYQRQKLYQLIADVTGYSYGYIQQIDMGMRSNGVKGKRIRHLLDIAEKAEQDLIRKIKAA